MKSNPSIRKMPQPSSSSDTNRFTAIRIDIVWCPTAPENALSITGSQLEVNVC